jgi:hypothetical protein
MEATFGRCLFRLGGYSIKYPGDSVRIKYFLLFRKRNQLRILNTILPLMN